MTIDTFAEAEALVDGFGARAAGSDPERRAARHLAGRLHAMGREAELESFSAWPAWPLAYALHAGIAILGSALSVEFPLAGAALVLVAFLLTLLDVSEALRTTRRLLGRRASQNVVSWGDRGAPGALVIVAHVDSGRGGLVRRDPWRRRLARVGPLSPLLWSLVAVLVCCLVRLADVDATWLSIVQFVPTVVLMVAVLLLLDTAIAPVGRGENDNASGVALALRLAERADPEMFGVHVVLTGSQKALGDGMRSFVRAHREELARDRTVVLNLDEVGDGLPRYTRREGALPALRSHPQLVRLAVESGEDGSARCFSNRVPSDGYAARSAGIAALTVTCRREGGGVSARLDEQAIAAAEAFCLELIDRIDGELGPELPAGPALSER
jgi:Peptidase family M28